MGTSSVPPGATVTIRACSVIYSSCVCIYYNFIRGGDISGIHVWEERKLLSDLLELLKTTIIYLLRYTDVGQNVLEKRKISVAAGNRNPDLPVYNLAIMPTELSRLPSVISAECSWLNDSKSIPIFTFDDRNEQYSFVRGRSNFMGGREDNTPNPFFVKDWWMYQF
jgi:hypothetical protein